MQITVLKGDGIGPEISESVMRIIDCLDLDIQWEVLTAGAASYEHTGELIPQSVYDSLEKNKVALKAPITTPIGKGFRSVNVALRKKYDLYTNLRPVKSIGKTKSLFKNIDLVLFRENLEDLYAGIEKDVSPDEKHSIKVITRKGSHRIIKKAFDYALKFGHKKMTVVTKANIMKLTDGLFLEVFRDVAKEYPAIETSEVLIDNMAMQLVMHPYDYDVIVTENLYGDILSDLMAGLIGGLGLVPGANIGDDIAIFEAAHGAAPDIAGKNKANPTALLLSACMMLDYIGEKGAAKRIRQVVHDVLSDEENFTVDLGGNMSTSDFTNRIIEHLNNQV